VQLLLTRVSGTSLWIVTSRHSNSSSKRLANGNLLAQHHNVLADAADQAPAVELLELLSEGLSLAPEGATAQSDGDSARDRAIKDCETLFLFGDALRE
jgi:hypothetical protein